MRAILAQAISDIRSKEHRASVILWTQSEWFETVCGHCDRCPDEVRRKLLGLTQKTKRISPEKAREMDARTKQIRQLDSQGMGAGDIASTLAVSKTYVYKILRTGGCVPTC